MNIKKIVIIGGTGNFGKFWTKYFQDKGFEVIITSRKTQIKPKDAVKLGDIIIISVPIRYTSNVIKELINYIPDNKLLIDFTGIKTDASNQLKKYERGEVVATHPMFGPWITSLKDQNIVFDPIKAGKKWDFLYSIWKNDGARLIEMSSYKHDELVSIVQSTVHIMNLVLGHILKQRGINLEELMKISTPNSRMQLFILSRFFKQEASLYTDMQIFNTLYKNDILPDIEKYFKDVKNIINEEDIETFENEFNSIKNYIGKEFIEKSFGVTNSVDAYLRNIT